MAILNGPAPFPKLPFGKPVKLGTVATATDGFQFSISEDSYRHAGCIIFQMIPVGGTITTFTANIQFSLDGGTTWDAQTSAGTATVASNTAGINFQTGHLENVAIPGIGGQVSIRFQTATFVLGTGTGADIWALVG